MLTILCTLHLGSGLWLKLVFRLPDALNFFQQWLTIAFFFWTGSYCDRRCSPFRLEGRSSFLGKFRTAYPHCCHDRRERFFFRPPNKGPRRRSNWGQFCVSSPRRRQTNTVFLVAAGARVKIVAQLSRRSGFSPGLFSLAFETVPLFL